MNRYLGITLGTVLSLLAVPGWLLADTATLMPNAVQQFFDSNGKPLSTGTVGFYTPNTLTPKTIWTDSGETTPQVNPVLLGISGRPTNAIYGSGIYRQQVKDHNGAVIWDALTTSTGGSGGGSAPAFSEGVMVGTLTPWAGLALPNKYLYAAGQAVSRATYPDLLTALTFRPSVLCQVGVATISVSTDISDKTPIGASVEFSCFAPPTTVIAKSSGQLTLSSAATTTVSTTGIIFPWGNGNGSTTFNVPQLMGKGVIGRNNMIGTGSALNSTYCGADPNGANVSCGNQSTTLVVTNLPPHQSINAANPISVVGATGHTLWIDGIDTSASISGGATHFPSGGGVATAGSLTFAGNNAINTTSDNTLSVPFSRLQPSVTSDYIIKALPDDTPGGPGVSSIQGMTGAIACGANLVCTGNTISVTVGVTSIQGMTGALTCGTGLTCSGSTITATGLGGTNPYVMPGDYLMVCDGVTNEATKFQNMINGSAGKTIYIPPGAGCKTNTTLTCTNSMTIIGGGWDSKIISGVVNDSLFTCTNNSDITIRDVWLAGSNTDTSCCSTGMFLIKIIQNGVAAGQNFLIQNVKQTGFNATYWNRVTTAGSTNLLRNFRFLNNYLVTDSSNIPADADPTNDTTAALVFQSATGGNGRIENTQVQGNIVLGDAFCHGVLDYANSYKALLTGNIITNVGSLTPAHCTNASLTANNAYAIAIYDLNSDGNGSFGWVISGNIIISPLSAGIYIVGDGGHTALAFNEAQGIISNNIITGQSADDDTSLPRAAIVINTTTGIKIIGNKLYANFGGIVVSGQTAGIVTVENNDCYTGVASVGSTPYCIKLLGGSNGSSNVDSRVVRGNTSNIVSVGQGSAILTASATGGRFNDVEISSNTINSAFNGLSFVSQFATGSLAFNANKFGGLLASYMFNIASLTSAFVPTLTNNVYDSAKGVNGNGLVATSSVVAIAGEKFVNRASGSVAMYSAVGTCGTVSGVVFNNVVQAAQVAATSLGTTNPSGCTLKYMESVQNLTPSEAGSAASKYVVDHWTHVSTTASTTHLEQRQLTGN